MLSHKSALMGMLAWAMTNTQGLSERHINQSSVGKRVEPASMYVRKPPSKKNRLGRKPRSKRGKNVKN